MQIVHSTTACILRTPCIPKKEFFIFSTISKVAPTIITKRHFSQSTPTPPQPYHFDRSNLKTLKMVQMIFRHGARTPIFPYPNDPNVDFDYGIGVKGEFMMMGQLTVPGRRQAFNLGLYLRDRYSGYLSNDYDPSDIYVQCSDRDRTIMTAQLCLAGLYLPNIHDIKHRLGIGGMDLNINWQPVPIRTIPKSMDNKISGDWKCPRQEQLINEYLNSDEVKIVDKDNYELYKYIEKHAGMEVKNYKKVYELVDTLSVQNENGLPLPPWTENIYPTHTKTLSKLEFVISTWNEESKRLRLGPLLFEMLKNFEVKMGTDKWNETDSNPLPTCKLYLYSGHDTTISSYLNTFDLYDDEESPEYASAVVLELHQNEDSYYLKLFYKKRKNEPILDLTLPNCPNPCPVEVFKEKFGKYLMSEVEWRSLME